MKLRGVKFPCYFLVFSFFQSVLALFRLAPMDPYIQAEKRKKEIKIHAVHQKGSRKINTHKELLPLLTFLWQDLNHPIGTACHATAR